MRRFRQITYAIIGLATSSFVSAAYSAETSTTQRATIAAKHKDASFSQKGIIVVGGKNKIGSDRMLNPQPLPPKDAGLSQKGIIVVGGNAMDRLSGQNPTVQGNKVRDGAKAPKAGELNMIQLQSQMSQRQQAIQLTTEMMRRQSESSSTIMRNLR